MKWFENSRKKRGFVVYCCIFSDARYLGWEYFGKGLAFWHLGHWYLVEYLNINMNHYLYS